MCTPVHYPRLLSGPVAFECDYCFSIAIGQWQVGVAPHLGRALFAFCAALTTTTTIDVDARYTVSHLLGAKFKTRIMSL